MNGITFIKEQGGIARSIAGEDHVSALVAYVANDELPAGFSTSNRIVVVSTPESAEALGLVPTSEDWIIKVLHYHVSEFFRVNPGGSLYIGLFAPPVGEYNYQEVKTVQNFADGRIRQVGVYAPARNLSAADITALQGVCDSLDTEHVPMSALLAANVSNAAALTTMHAPGQANVSVVIGQAGAGTGAELYDSSGETKKSVTIIGLALGAVSKAMVHESISWVQRFPSGIDTPALADGALIKNLDRAVIEALDAKRFLFLVKHGGIAGSYFNDSHNMDVPTSDYAYIENVRTMDKAVRGVRSYLLPYLSGPLYLDADSGRLRPDTVTFLEQLGGKALEDMERAGELSGYDVSVDPNQDVLQTSEVEFVIRKVGVGVMRRMKVKISYTTKIE